VSLRGRYMRPASFCARSRYRHVRAACAPLSWIKAPAPDKREAEIFIDSHMVHAQSQEWYILDGADLESEFGSELGGRPLDGLGDTG